ncbi:MAG TPA: adenylate/guanylate cyclase domain-containing protein, partial [Leptospiraceae bacterium]|nr:adenylate/guanylate cyclase domain-containing protein [Leptospiraceae bacterium]
MTILFSDIRSFTALSEKMSPEENFQFINGYLGRVSPIIRKHRGFIDKYIGDAVMALFPIQPQDAVLAALEMQKEVFIYNSHRLSIGYEPIQIGVGIHTGSVILGTIGEEKRMEGTVISDVVNTASRLESLTKKFGSAILISDEVYNDLPTLEPYQFRYLGKVRVKGKSKSIKIYELLDAAPTEMIASKIQTREEFHLALKLYQSKGFAEAYRILSEKVFPIGNDKAAEYYIKQIQKFLKFGIPENWDGVEDMEDK